MKDELGAILDIANISPEHLQGKKIGPGIFQTYQKLSLEKRQTDGYYMVVLGYGRSPFWDPESFLKIVVGLNEDDNQVILEQWNSNFLTDELPPGLYSL